MKNKTLILLLAAFVMFSFFGCSPENKKPENTDNTDNNEQVKLPVIIDSDMGFDDWMAILYLLNKSEIDIKAITVDCAGETHCPAGAVNATKLLKLAGKADIPVYYGKVPPSTLAYQFPAVIRDGATAMDVPGFDSLPGTKNYFEGAGSQLVTLALEAGKSNQPLTIISIGTATNIAQAVHQTKDKGLFDDFSKGIKMIYKGGGAVGEAENDALTNNNIPGNLNIPGLFSSPNTTAAWNIYANASASEVLFASGLPITQIPVNLSNQVDITEQSYNQLKAIAKTESANFVLSDIKVNIDGQGGWGVAELDYWDPSVAVAALNPDFITTKYGAVQICIDVQKGDVHGTTYVNSSMDGSTKCKEVKSIAGLISVYTAIDTAKFYNDFNSTLNK